MKYFVVCNPGARSGRAAKVIREYRRHLDGSGTQYECGWTESLADAAPMTREALAKGFDAVVAVGGDGTINRVINGFFSDSGEIAKAPFGVLYAGTSPDFCRFHGLPAGGREAVRALLSGEAHPIDLCEIRSLGADAPESVSRLACSVNIGLGPRIAGRANRSRRYFGDFVGTLLATLASICEGRTFAADLTVDGSPVRLEKVWNLTAGKNPFLASGLKLGLRVAPDDGRLFVFGIAGVGRAGFIGLIPKVYSGMVVEDPRFFRGDCIRLRVEPGGAGVGFEFDGDPAGSGPIEVRVLPRALSLLGGHP